jgi:hypothetical protein
MKNPTGDPHVGQETMNFIQMQNNDEYSSKFDGYAKKNRNACPHY